MDLNTKYLKHLISTFGFAIIALLVIPIIGKFAIIALIASIWEGYETVRVLLYIKRYEKEMAKALIEHAEAQRRKAVQRPDSPYITELKDNGEEPPTQH